MSLLSECRNSEDVSKRVNNVTRDLIEDFKHVVKHAMEKLDMYNYKHIDKAFNIVFKLEYFKNTLEKWNNNKRFVMPFDGEDYTNTLNEWEATFWELKDKIHFISFLMCEYDEEKGY